MTTFGFVHLMLWVLSLLLRVYGQGEGAIRLVNGAIPSQGRVEVYANGQWGTVCSDYWGTSDAIVVCKQLGYNDMAAVEYHRYAYFGQGSGAIHLDNVECDGTEKKLFDCPHNGIGVHDCSHYYDAGVTCGCMSEPDCAIPAQDCIYGLTEKVEVDHQICPICRCASCPLQPRCPTNCKSGKTEYYDGRYCRRCRCVPQELPEVIVEPNDISVGMMAGVVAVALGLPSAALFVVCMYSRKQGKGRSRPGNYKDNKDTKDSKDNQPANQENWFDAVSGGQKPKAVAIF